MNKLEVLMLKLESLKAEYAIIKDKLLLFSGGFAGSVSIIINDNNLLFTLSATAFGSASFIGILLNLYKAGKISKEINTLKEELKND